METDLVAETSKNILTRLSAWESLIEFSALFELYWTWFTENGPGGSAGIATGYGLDGPWIESRWARDFPHLSRPALGSTQPLYKGYRDFPGGKVRPGRNALPLTPPSAVVKKE